MNKKILLSAMLLLLSVISSFASETMLVVQMKDSSITLFKFDDNPVITFDTGMMIVCTDNTQIQFEVAQIDDYHFTSITTAIDAVKGNEMRFIRTSNEVIKVQGALNAQKVCVFDINGAQMPLHMSKGSNEIAISFADYPAGLYILKVSNNTIKIQKK